jgi:hypothetical protein
VLTKVLGCKRDDVTGERRIRGALWSVLITIIRVIKSRRWVRYVASMGHSKCPHRILVGKPEGKDHSEDLGLDARMMIKFIFNKWERGRRV